MISVSGWCFNAPWNPHVCLPHVLHFVNFSQYYLTAVLDMFRVKKVTNMVFLAVVRSLVGFNVIWIHKFFSVNVKLSIPTLSHNCTKGVSPEQ